MNTESKVPAPVSTTSSIPQHKPTAEFESSQPNQTVPTSITTPLPSPPSSFHSSTPPYMKQDHQQSHPRMNNQQKWQKKRKGNFQNRHQVKGIGEMAMLLFCVSFIVHIRWVNQHMARIEMISMVTTHHQRYNAILDSTYQKYSMRAHTSFVETSKI